MAAVAREPTTIAVTISPAEIHVAQSKPVILKVTNQDPTPEEFDSTALQVERSSSAAPAGRSAAAALVRRYFSGECGSDTALGVLSGRA